jgi:protein-tyrosine-phosphatase
MPSVLFVCEANSFRSQMAEAFARSLGGPAWQAASAGSHPGGRVHPLAIQAMAERGLDLSGHQSKGVAGLPPRQWDYVVTMGCGDTCPTVPARHRIDWPIPDPAAGSPEDVRRIRDQIETLVRALLASAATS